MPRARRRQSETAMSSIVLDILPPPHPPVLHHSYVVISTSSYLTTDLCIPPRLGTTEFTARVCDTPLPCPGYHHALKASMIWISSIWAPASTKHIAACLLGYTMDIAARAPHICTPRISPRLNTSTRTIPGTATSHRQRLGKTSSRKSDFRKKLASLLYPEVRGCASSTSETPWPPLPKVWNHVMTNRLPDVQAGRGDDARQEP
ncbi:hypothetical protein C8Q76DRAFT_140338 [Earliella scabrosa]|nr:hypothetical protein C8Q76DRAFT_140338 [Earliella scabrosa]